MSDRVVLAVAIGAVVGAWLAEPVPVPIVAIVALVAAVVRRPWLLVVVAVLLASLLGARAWSGLAPAEPAAFDAPVTLVGDPETIFGAVRVDVRAEGRRLEAWVRGAGSGRLRSMLAGEQVELRGRLAPRPDDAPWLVARHIVGRLEVAEVGASRPGDPFSRLANGLRRTLHAGAAGLPEQRRALFTGLVIGDDRDQDPLTEDDFRGAGLTHLLAVSGQNVAFVLTLVGPLIGRLGWRSRFVATVGVLVFFALLTRFEPSVLRATTMAGLAMASVTWGRTASGLRLLGLAVAVLVLVDPLLVHSVGFRLSVGASAGIALLARPLADRLPGPLTLRSAVAVTLAAQVGVAPVLLPVFGGLPVAAVPANVLAAPPAGPVMVWGLTAGLVAGVVGPTLAGLLHAPTALLVAWIAGVARVCTASRLGELTTIHAVVLVVSICGALALGRRARWASSACAVLALVVALHPAVMLRRGPMAEIMLAPGATLHRGSVLVVESDVVARGALEGLRRRGVARLDLIVATNGGARPAEAIALVRRRYGSVPVLAPPGHRVRGAVGRAPPWAVRVGDLVVDGQPEGDPDRVTIHVRTFSEPGG